MMKHIAAAGEKRTLIRRITVFSIAVFFLGILQCSFLSRLSPFGAVPDIMLGMLCAILLLDCKGSAAICAVAAGYFIDALGAVPPSFSPLFYVISAGVLGILSEKMMPRFVSYAVLLMPAAALRAVYTYVSLCIAMSGVPPLSAFTGVILPELLSTLVCCLPVYFLIKLCMLPIGARGKFSF